MKYILTTLFACTLLTATAEAADLDGKKVFLEYKCNGCHSIKAEKIERAGDEPKEDQGPDLSGLGAKKDATWVENFLLKKEKSEKGNNHKKKFRGEDAELKAVAKYVASLKTP